MFVKKIITILVFFNLLISRFLFGMISEAKCLTITKKREKHKDPFKKISLSEWLSKFKDIPSYSDEKEQDETTFLERERFKCTIKKFLEIERKGKLNKEEYWLDEKVPHCISNWDVKSDDFVFLPYREPKFFVQKLVLDPESKVMMVADRHGDINSLAKLLLDASKKGYIDDRFNIIKPNLNIVFLGDYVDRGYYGAEVLYTLMHLKISNPDKVVLLRGNHENKDMNMVYEFSKELCEKFYGHEGKLKKLIGEFYELLPSAVYIGTGEDFALFCHGGLEPLFDPRKLLLDERKCLFQCIELDRSDFSWLGKKLRGELEKVKKRTT